MASAWLRVLIMACGVWMLAGSTAQAQSCDVQARQAADYEYDRVFRNCTDGGGGTDCRYNSDCAINQECRSGRCVAAPITCIRRCSARNSQGSCYQYAQDFCGRGPGCTAICTARNSQGSCYQYGGDRCAEGGVSCTPNCMARDSQGNCYQYGPDLCYEQLP